MKSSKYYCLYGYKTVFDERERSVNSSMADTDREMKTVEFSNIIRQWWRQNNMFNLRENGSHDFDIDSSFFIIW